MHRDPHQPTARAKARVADRAIDGVAVAAALALALLVLLLLL